MRWLVPVVIPVVVAVAASGCGAGDGAGDGDQGEARRDLERARSSAEAAVDDVERAFASIPDTRTLPGRGSFESCTAVRTTDPRYVAHLLFGDLSRDASQVLAQSLEEAGWTVGEPRSPGHDPARRGRVEISADIQDGGAMVRIETGCVEAPEEVAEEYVDRPVTRYRDES